MRNLATILTAIAVAAAIVASLHSASADPPPQAAATRPSVDAGIPDEIRFDELGQRLMAALKATPGCLGIDLARMESGKFVIFAWFENKRAVLAWHGSAAHQAAKRVFFPTSPNPEEYKPLDEVPDDVPLMVVASLSFAAPEADDDDAPAPLFGIEVFAPATAGLRVSPAAGFSPAEFSKLFKAPERAASTQPASP